MLIAGDGNCCVLFLLLFFFLLCCLLLLLSLLLFSLLHRCVHKFSLLFPSVVCIYIILVLHFLLATAKNIHSTWLTFASEHTVRSTLGCSSSTTTWLRSLSLSCLPAFSACCMLLAMVFRDNFIVIFYTLPSLPSLPLFFILMLIRKLRKKSEIHFI